MTESRNYLKELADFLNAVDKNPNWRPALEIVDLQSQVERLTKERDVLLEALKEIYAANVKDNGDPDEGFQGCVGWGNGGEMALTFEILKKAKAAIAAVKGE